MDMHVDRFRTVTRRQTYVHMCVCVRDFIDLYRKNELESTFRVGRRLRLIKHKQQHLCVGKTHTIFTVTVGLSWSDFRFPCSSRMNLTRTRYGSETHSTYAIRQRHSTLGNPTNISSIPKSYTSRKCFYWNICTPHFRLNSCSGDNARSYNAFEHNT